MRSVKVVHPCIFGITLALILFGGLRLLGSADAAPTDTITIVNLNDSGAGSLRQAIADAESGDTIEFSVTGTITLTSGQLTINKNLTISGPGEDQLTINGNDSFRVFEIAVGDYDVTLTGLTIADGYTLGDGAGIKNGSVEGVIIEGVTFSSNSADNYGGGMYDTIGSTTLSKVTFADNSAALGGGLFNPAGSNPILSNVILSGNSARLGGGMYNSQSNPIMYNVTFADNSAHDSGGGMRNEFSDPAISNSIFWGNTAVTGSQIHNLSSTPDIDFSDIQGSGGSDSWDSSLGTDGGNNIDADPLFVSSYDDLRLQPGSPAINSGYTDGCASTDMDGNSRPYGPACDMGAYETTYPLLYYVDAGAPGSIHTGLSWTDAFTTVQDSLAVAHYGAEIWVAEGVYYPDEGRGATDNSRDSTYRLKEQIAIYGGFDPGSGADDFEERDWQTYVTILSGDIDGNDINADWNFTAESTPDIQGNNAYHVIFNQVYGAPLIDGFTITAGKANGGSYPDDIGGGVYNDSSSLRLTNVVFSGNSAHGAGGGLMTNDRLFDRVRLTNVIFSSNSALQGGGMYGHNCTDWGSGRPTLSNVVFTDNWAKVGGGMGNQGCDPRLTNVTFANNLALHEGGGMYNFADSTPILTNAILWGNSASIGDQLFNSNDSSSSISFSDIQGSGGSENWDASLGTDGGGNIDADPIFVSNFDDLHLQSGSPGIDVGTNTRCPATDLEGRLRPFGGICDMGAYEFDEYLIYVPLIQK